MKGERRTSNFERRTSNGKDGRAVWDLEERLLDFGARIVRLAESLPKGRAGSHIGGQLLRSGTSPLFNHGEAESAESRADFLHKLHLFLKELRETHRCLKLIQRVPLVRPASKLDALVQEADELVRIFVSSVRTAAKRAAASQ